jgi:hypothetical protein
MSVAKCGKYRKRQGNGMYHTAKLSFRTNVSLPAVGRETKINKQLNILDKLYIIGGSGFIGKNMVRCYYEQYKILVVDKQIDTAYLE